MATAGAALLPCYRAVAWVLTTTSAMRDTDVHSVSCRYATEDDFVCPDELEKVEGDADEGAEPVQTDDVQAPVEAY